MHVQRSQETKTGVITQTPRLGANECKRDITSTILHDRTPVRATIRRTRHYGECRKLRNGATGFQASLMLLNSFYVIGR